MGLGCNDYGWLTGFGLVKCLFQVYNKVLVEHFDARDEKMIAVAEVYGVLQREYLVTVWPKGLHLLFEPLVVLVGGAELVGVLHLDKHVGDFAFLEEFQAAPQGIHLLGADDEVVARIAFADKLFGADFHVATWHILGIFKGVLLVERLQPVADLLVVEAIETGVYNFHVACVPSHLGGLPSERSVNEEVHGALDAVVLHDVRMDLEDHETGVEAVQVLPQQNVGLHGRLVGGAEVEAADALGAVVARVEGAVAVGGAQEKHIDVVVVANVFDAGVEESAIAHLGAGSAYPAPVAQQPQQWQVS